MARCSIVIPVHNRAAFTRRCLDALLAVPPKDADLAEIVVADDASSDATQALLAHYDERLLGATLATNGGFAEACNVGASVASGEYLVFLNNDTVPQPGWLDALVGYADAHPEAAVVGSKLLFPNDTIQHAGVVICQDRLPRHVYAGFPADHPAVNRSRRFQVVTAASVLIRRGPFDAVGGFDATFRNGFEDVDLCLRLGERGAQVHYCHESALYHLESVSRDPASWQERENLRRYYRRWYDRVEPDDLEYYLEDGLLGLAYRRFYPVTFSLSPLLGVLDAGGRSSEADRLLADRSRQVFELQKENVGLRVRLNDAERDAAVPSPGAARSAQGFSDAPRPVSIVMPVHNAFDSLVVALQSVIRHTNLSVHHLIIVDDASTDPRIRTYLENLAPTPSLNIRVIRNKRNKGFSRSVNLGIKCSSGDVLLLNSDTIVTVGWLEKLQRAAGSRPGIASATPFSNNAALCSIPEFFEPNDVPEGFTVDSFAALVERLSFRAYPEIPTAVGFCMYIARDALTAVGLFDERRFARGYGEENDWCMRARKLGYAHVLDDATYVYHRGAASFGPERKAELVARHHELLRALHPGYHPALRAFARSNPLRPLHEHLITGMNLARSLGHDGATQTSSANAQAHRSLSN